MTELLARDEFRTALEEAIKGRQAKDASFSLGVGPRPALA